MSLTDHDVKNIAHLARLALSEEQVPVYVDSLSKIFDFVAQLNAADTASVEPMAHPPTRCSACGRMKCWTATSTANISAMPRASKRICISCPK